MRAKILLLLSLLLGTISINAQVSVDKTEDDGSRLIISQNYNIYTGWTNAASANVAYVCYNDSTKSHFYFINLTLNEDLSSDLDKGRKLLIKLGDESIITLTTDLPLDIFSSTRNSFGDRLIHPQYSIDEATLKKIINGNATKLRIETNLGYLDRVIKKNKFSEALKKGYENIQKALKVKNDIYSGF